MSIVSPSISSRSSSRAQPTETEPMGTQVSVDLPVETQTKGTRDSRISKGSQLTAISATTGKSLRHREQDRTHYLDAMLNMCGKVSARAGFLAGFSYYEFSRVSRTLAPTTPQYPLLLYSAFALSLVAVAISSLINMHASRIHKDEANDLALVLYPQTRLGGVIGGPAQWAYRCFIGAMVCYTIALSYMTDYFWPLQGSYWKALDPFVEDGKMEYVVLRWYARTVFWLVGVVIVIIDIILRWKKKKHITEANEEDIDRDAWHSDVKLVEMLGGRALFLMGFLGHAMARWVGENVQSEYASMNKLYLFFACTAAACLIMTVLSCALFVIHLHDMVPKYRSSFAMRLKWQRNLCLGLFSVGLTMVIGTAALMGWGCTRRCGDEKVDDGSCYGRVAWVPASAMCIVVTVVAIFGVITRVQRQQSLVDNDARDFNDEDGEVAERVLKSSLDTSNSATILGAFVLYNIATFDIEVIRAPILEANVNFGMTPAAWIFLLANWLTFSLTLSVTIAVLMVEVEFRSLTSVELKVRFVSRMKPYAETLMYMFVLSMCTFMMALSIFGITKLSPYRIEATIVAIIALVLMGIRAKALHDASKKVVQHSHLPEQSNGIMMAPRLCYVHGDGTVIQEERSYENTLALVGAYSRFVGIASGFAYNAVDFLYRPTATFAPAFLTLMALCFTCSLSVTIFQTLLSYHLSKFNEIPVKEAYINEIRTHIQWNSGLSILAVLSFLLAFSILGWIKQWRFDLWQEEFQVPLSEQYGWMQCATAMVTFVAIFLAKYWLDGVVHDCKNEKVPSHENYHWKDFLKELDIRSGAASFQLGNVFYEILFAEVNLNREWATWFYFGLAGLTFCLALVNVVVASMLSYQMHLLPPQRRGSLGFRTQHIRNFLTVSYVSSLLTWMAHFGFSGSLKVDVETLDIWSALIGAIGFLLIVLYWAYIAIVSSRFRRIVEVDGYGVTVSDEEQKMNGLFASVAGDVESTEARLVSSSLVDEPKLLGCSMIEIRDEIAKTMERLRRLEAAVQDSRSVRSAAI